MLSLHRLRHSHIVWQCLVPDLGASQEFNIEKLHMLEAEKGRVRKDSERREGLIETKKKIEYSKQLNASRIKVPFHASAPAISARCLLSTVGQAQPRETEQQRSVMGGRCPSRRNPQRSGWLVVERSAL